MGQTVTNEFFFVSAELAIVREHYKTVPNPCRKGVHEGWKLWEAIGHDVISENVPGIVVLEGRHRVEYLLEKLREDPSRALDPRKVWIHAFTGEVITPETVPEKM